MSMSENATELRTHFVYRFFDGDGHVLYVGCTKDIVRRLKSHRQDNRHFFHRIARITQQGPFPQLRALQLEKRLIEELRPVFGSTPERRQRLAEKKNWITARSRELCGGRPPRQVPVQEYLRLTEIARSEAERLFPGISDSCSPHPQELTEAERS